MFAKALRYILVALVIAVMAAPGLAAQDEAKYTARLADALNAEGPLTPVWVRFADKGLTAAETDLALDALTSEMSAGMRARRSRGTLGGQAADAADLPLNPAYLEAVAATGAVNRRQSRWLNAASYNATPQQIRAIAALPFVTAIDLVGRGEYIRPEFSTEPPAAAQALTGDKNQSGLPYGASRPALEQINVTGAHELGLSGEGVTVAVFDTGFELDHECFQQLDIVATWDFVNDDEYVGPRAKEDIYQALYGTSSLSALAGYSAGNLIGPAYGASVILAKTEDLSDETPAEEDNWIAALEWAEGLGVDVVSSSLGYYQWYSFADLDGQTTLITVAAELAAARGVFVVNGVGDQGQNPEWPHILPPCDGRSVIAVGSVDLLGAVTPLSGPGPTADGRTKPDVMALGAGVNVANDYKTDLYYYGYTTHFAVPLVAGTVALMLEQNPGLTPTDAAEALRETASRASAPDNNSGWGVIDAVAAMNYWSPEVNHVPLTDNEGGIGAYPVTATITASRGLDEGRTWVAWSANGGPFKLESLAPVGGNVYTGYIPPQPRSGTDVDYYLVATDSTGMVSHFPASAPTEVFSFHVGPDTTPPVIQHVSLPDQIQADWPPVLIAEVTDNAEVASVELTFSPNPGTATGPFFLNKVGDHYELPFPVDQAYAQPGLTFNYMLIARDNAQITNFAFSGNKTFSIVTSKGNILVVDNQSQVKSAASTERARSSSALVSDKSAADLAGWIIDAGFTCDVIGADEADFTDFLPYDAVVVSCGGNYDPLNLPLLRQAMVRWVEVGGRLLVEGGEVAYVADVAPGYPELMGTVLPIASYGGETGNKLYVPSSEADHPLLNRPYHIKGPLEFDNYFGNDYGACDLVDAAPEGQVIMRAGFGTYRGGIIAYDNNTGPDAGQIVYLPFDLQRPLETESRRLIDNCLTYLLFNEPPGTGSISGTVILAGEADQSGVTVRAGVNQSTVTAADGSFLLGGLWGGKYNITAEKAGFSPQYRDVTVTDDTETAGVEFYLLPVTEIQASSAPALVIPDNNPAGVSDGIVITESGPILGITVDIDLTHFAIGQLSVVLTSPSGTSVTLHNRTGGTADNLVGNWPESLAVDGPGSLVDFLNEPIQGTWTLHVTDFQLGALGTLNSWGLNLMVVDDQASAVGDGLPQVTRLVGNAPNPFNPSTTISFELARSGPVRLEIYDVQGRLVRTLEDRVLEAGAHSVPWDGRNGQGGETASGLYFFRMTTDDATQTKKMMLVK